VTPFDLVTMGRIGVDLYPEQTGVPLEEVRSFRKLLGGSATNVAVAAAKLGREVALVTKVGDDGFGRFARSALAGFGVDARWVGTHPRLRTPLAFCEIHPPDHFPLTFYREPSAPDLQIKVDELDRAALADAAILWTTGTGLSVEPSRAATLAALALRGQDGLTVHDLDVRPMLWDDPREIGEWNRQALEHATVAVGNRMEAAHTVGDAAPDELADRLLAHGLRLAVVKLGPEGVLAAAADGTRVRVEPVRVDVVNGLGAGDAFGGALCHGLLAGWELERVIRFANAAGALVTTRLGCADDMPTEAEVEALAGAPAAR
jgi:5-dehydro-2-deoxygluconokinase